MAKGTDELAVPGRAAALVDFTPMNALSLREDPASEPASAAALQAWERDIQGAPPVCPAREEDPFPIIVHCHLRWDFVWQRPQQIFSRLAARHRILFIEEPIFLEASPDDDVPRLDISEPLSNVVRVVPMLPQGSAASVDAQCQALLTMLGQALREHPLLAGRFERPVQWFYSPMTAPCLLGKFDARGVVYDCMDELANFRFAPPDIGAREQFLLERADLVFTGGYQLFESKSRHHHNVHFYGCGVDVRHFGKASLDETVVPEDVAALPGPVFGYFGVIDERLDYPLLQALAERFPQASIAMAGPFAKVDPEQLPRLPNIHWLGQRAYEELPALVKGFDVCLMPFALNDATRYINPTKTLEYMAAAKPVVSTAVADVVRNFTPIVDVAWSQEEFLDAVERAWKCPDPERVVQGVVRAGHASWEATVAEMEQDIRTALCVAEAAATPVHARMELAR
jgi:glycosyltransferase involved in cell wall biosynthesis